MANSSVVSQRALFGEQEPPQGRLGRLVYWIKRRWILGSSQTEAALLPVVDAYADTLRTNVMSVRYQLPDDDATRKKWQQIHDDLNIALDATAPDLAVLLGIEAQLLSIFPEDMRSARSWLVRERFDRVAANNASLSFLLLGQGALTSPDAGSGKAKDKGQDIKKDQVPDPVSPKQDGNGAPNHQNTPQSASDTKAKSAPVGFETQALLSYIHKSYLMNIAREKAISYAKFRLGQRFWATLFFLLVLIPAVAGLISCWITFCGGYRLNFPFVIAVTLILFLGSIGAIMSITRRMQGAVSDNVLNQDPLGELVGLRVGFNGLKLSIISGAIFALILAMLFATGVPDKLGFSGGVFPKFVFKNQNEPDKIAAPEGKGSAAGTKSDRQKAVQAHREQHAEQMVSPSASTPLLPLVAALGLDGETELFKLLIWAFIAGFAERLVPDVLDRIANPTDHRTAKTPSVSAAAASVPANPHS